jgi:hypothetical protein
LSYGYALYQSDEREKALQHFEMLFKSANIFRQQAAKYFMGKIYLKNNNKQEAKNLLDEIISSGYKSKYFWLAQGIWIH